MAGTQTPYESWLQRQAIRVYVLVVTVCSIAYCFWDRDLFFFEEVDIWKDGLAHPVCYADGIVLGMTIAIISLKFVAYIRGTEAKIEPILIEAAGAFSLYSVLVGIPMFIWKFDTMTTFQIAMYPLLCVANVRNVRTSWTLDRAK